MCGARTENGQAFLKNENMTVQWQIIVVNTSRLAFQQKSGRSPLNELRHQENIDLI